MFNEFDRLGCALVCNKTCYFVDCQLEGQVHLWTLRSRGGPLVDPPLPRGPSVDPPPFTPGVATG